MTNYFNINKDKDTVEDCFSTVSYIKDIDVFNYRGYLINLIKLSTVKVDIDILLEDVTLVKTIEHLDINWRIKKEIYRIIKIIIQQNVAESISPSMLLGNLK